MNLFGSYRALLGNAVAALSSSIEIYNKPNIDYREECSVILLVNAWELLLKAILSKNRQRIYYKKRRGQPYRTYSISDALNRASTHFPSGFDFDATAKNLELLVEYRDNAIHFYNSPGFGVLLYSLAQTAVTNFSDLVSAVFDKDLSEEITLSLLPLSIAPPVDAVQFLTSTSTSNEAKKSVREFTAKLKELVVELEESQCDTGRLMTVFRPHLVSTKKISEADFVVGVDGDVPDGDSGTPILVQRRVDPNRSHPYRETDIITKVTDPPREGMGIVIGDEPLTQYGFRALGHHLKVKEEPQYCWRDRTGAVTRYSPQYVEKLRRITPAQLNAAIDAYRDR